MQAKLEDLMVHYRYRPPGGGKPIGVHEAARRAGEMLTSRGDVVQGALLTAEYFAAVANRDGLGRVLEYIKESQQEGRLSQAFAEIAATLASSTTAAEASAARLQVYMQAFAPEFTKVHPDNMEDLES